MLGTIVLSSTSQDKSPNHPIMSIFRLFLDTLSDLLYSFDNVALFELCKGPVHMRVVSMSIEFFGLSTNVQGFFIDHVHVEQEGQVVVGVWMFVVQHDALLEVLNGL